MGKALQKFERMLKDRKIRRIPLDEQDEKKLKAQKIKDLIDLKDHASLVFMKKLDKISDQLEDLLHTEVPVSVDVQLPEMPEYPEFPKIEIPEPADMTETNNLLKKLIKEVVNNSKKIDTLNTELQKPVNVILEDEND